MRLRTYTPVPSAVSTRMLDTVCVVRRAPHTSSGNRSFQRAQVVQITRGARTTCMCGDGDGRGAERTS